MKVIFKKEFLFNSINIVIKAVSQKTTMPILQCILIEAGPDGVCLMSNDTELAINTYIDNDKCNVIEGGRIAVDAKLLFEIIRKIATENDSDITFTSDGSIVEIICDNSQFKIQERDADQFPSLPEVNEDRYLSLSQFTLKEVIKDTIFSILPNDSNKMMGGELFEVKGDNLRVVSLDGHRISIRNTALKDHYDDIEAVIPGKTLIEISKILTGEADKEVNIFFTKNHAMFRFEDTVMVTRLIDGEYFRIDNMLSSDYETKLTVNRQDFLDSIERACVLVRESDKKPLVINITDDTAAIRMNSVIGSLDDRLLVTKEGKDLMIAFNPRFLLDALRVIEDDEVSLCMTNSKAPCFIRDDEGKYIYLILPVNFNPASY